MRYERALQANNGVWRWTCQYDNDIFTYPPCTLECQHQTKEEAERHYYEDEVSKITTHKIDAHYKCEFKDCDTLTNLVLGPPSMMGRISHLCPEHCNEHVYRLLNPFVQGCEHWGS